MARNRFNEARTYAGRLLTVRRRAVENRDPDIALLRLEFEIFVFEDEPTRLKSYGRVACRDIIVTPNAAFDPGVAPFAAALKVRHPDKVTAWFKAAEARPWVQIRFGSVDPEDERNHFAEIAPFSPAGHGVQEFDFALGGKWGGVEEAAEELGCSVAHARRLVDKYAAEHGANFAWRTAGGHRRINLLLLRHLGEEKVERQLRELLERNKRFKK